MLSATLFPLADVVVVGLGIAAVVAIILGGLGAAASIGFIRTALRSRGGVNAIVACLASAGLGVSLLLLWWGISFWWPFIF